MSFFVSLWAPLTAPSMAVALPEVRIAAWEQEGNGTGVTFKPMSPTRVSDDPPALPNATDAGRFEYAIDTSDLKWAIDCRCFRYYVVVVRSMNRGTVSRHKFRAHPSGSFEDQNVIVRLTITEEGESDSENVSLPIAPAQGLEPAPLVKASMTKGVEVVSLGGETTVALQLHNPSRDMAMQVPSDIVLTPNDDGLWGEPPAYRPVAFPMTLDPGATATVTLRLVPRTWEAIQRSMLPAPADVIHTVIRVRVPYTNPLFQLRDGGSDLDVKLRFQPSIPSLLIALLLGVVLGSLATAVRRGDSPRAWAWATGSALLTAGVLQILGWFFVATRSKFVLFDREIDPWQTLPVVVLGIANGLLGLKASDLLKKVAGFFE